MANRVCSLIRPLCTSAEVVVVRSLDRRECSSCSLVELCVVNTVFTVFTLGEIASVPWYVVGESPMVKDKEEWIEKKRRRLWDYL